MNDKAISRWMKKHKRTLAALYGVYLVAIGTVWLLPIIADVYIDDIREDMNPYYNERLTWASNGPHPTKPHYYVERANDTAYAYVTANYTTATNTLRVTCTNVKILHIQCRELYEFGSDRIFKKMPIDDSNLYKRYFIEANDGIFTVHLDLDEDMQELRFVDTPTPYSVLVNNEAYTTAEEWWIAGVNYTYNENQGVVITNVPEGHTDVEIHFKSPASAQFPVAQLVVDKTLARVNETVGMDASGSYDPDGSITAFLWDFGDGSFASGNAMMSHSYDMPGNYTVIMTVRDNDYLVDRQYRLIHVYMDNTAPDGAISLPVNDEVVGDVAYDYVVQDVPDATYNSDDDIADAVLQYYNGTAWVNLTTQSFTDWIPQDGTVITWDTHDVPDGSYLFRVEMQDTSGNTGASPSTRQTVDNEDPVADAGPDATINEGEAHTFDANNSSDNHAIANYTWHFGDGTIGYGKTVPHTYARDGRYTATLEVRDEAGNKDVDYVDITVLDVVNEPPYIFGVPTVFVHYDVQYPLDLSPYITDLDTPIDQLTVTTSEPADRISVSGLVLTFEYPETMIDRNVNVTITVKDDMGDTDSDLTTVHVTDNYPPEYTDYLYDVEFFEGEVEVAFDLDDYFTDRDKDELTYHYFGNDKVSVAVNANKVVSFSCFENWGGSETIKFRAYDPHGAFAERTMIATVIPVDTPPTISGVPDPTYVGYGFVYTLDLAPYVRDDGNIFDLEVTANKTWITTSGIQLILDYSGPFDPSKPLHEYVRITVSDANHSASQDIIIIITSNRPPVYHTNIGNITINEDEVRTNAIDLDNYFSDPDGSVSGFIADVRNFNITATVKSDGSVDFAAKEDWFGKGYVAFIATDDAGIPSKPASVIVNVLPVNDAPYQTQNITLTTVLSNETWFIDLDDYFDDIDDKVLTYACNKKDITIDPLTHIARWVPGSNNSLEGVIFTAGDKQLNASSNPIDIKVIRPTVEELSPWFWLLVALAAVLGAGAVLGYWKITRKYDIEQVFLIYESGILIAHESKIKKEDMDDEILGSMLSGIQDFIRDAFMQVTDVEDAADFNLKKLEFGEKNIMIARGSNIFIAAVFAGYATEKLESELAEVISEIEERFGEVLKTWDGHMSQVVGTEEIISKLVIMEE